MGSPEGWITDRFRSDLWLNWQVRHTPLQECAVNESERSRMPPHEHKDESLATLKAQLLQEIASRERAEAERADMEQGLREVRERFESAFANAPIGMALVDLNGEWLQSQ